MVSIMLGFLLFPCALLAQGPNCTTTIDRLPDPASGGYAFTSTTTCGSVIGSMTIGFDGWIGSSTGGGFGFCADTKTCTIRDVLTCAYPGTYDVRGYADIGGIRTYSAPLTTVVNGPAQLSVRFESSQTPGYGRAFIDYSIPQQFYPHSIQVYVYTPTILTSFNSGFVALSGTWEIPLDLPEGTVLEIYAGVQCPSDQGGYATATVHLPGSIEFNVTDTAPESERRVLLSNLHSGYVYPHFQSIGGQDRMVPLFLRTRNGSGQLESGRTVYLRVVDPPDTAAYMNLPQNKQAHDGDNDGPRATVEGNAITPGPGLPGATWQGTTGAGGQLDFALSLPQGAAAGDNYQIEAAFDSTFPTGMTFKSGTLTAWKRIFVEKRKMLRNGILLRAPAASGTSTIRVGDDRYRGNQGHRRLHAGDTIVIIHAPDLGRNDAIGGWYLEYHTIADVQAVPGTGDFDIALGTRQGHNVTPEILQHPFAPDSIDPQVGDGIAFLGGAVLTGGDYFDAPDTLLAQYDAAGNPASCFSQSFTEYYVLPDSSLINGFVPVPHIETSTEIVLQHIADRWSQSVAAGGVSTPNHQLHVIADTNGVALTDEAGHTTSNVGGEIASFTFRGTIDAQVKIVQSPYHGQNATNWAAKDEAHELAHQWSVNLIWRGTSGATLGHCPADSTVFDNPTFYCLEATSSTTGSDTQSDNLIARFHLRQDPSGHLQSEYLEIRRRQDPFVP
jgi:hypothetical protein